MNSLYARRDLVALIGVAVVIAAILVLGEPFRHAMPQIIDEAGAPGGTGTQNPFLCS